MTHNRSCRWLAVVAIALCTPLAGKALAVPPDAARIAALTGRAVDTQGEVVKVSVPRMDLAVRVADVAMSPFQGFTSWAAFQRDRDQTIVMGDMVVTEAEAMAALDAALGAGLDVTALHNHFFGEQPRVFFMHISGHGSTETLAMGVKKVFDAIDVAARSGAAAGAAAARGAPLAVPSRIDEAPLAALLGVPGQSKDGMVKFVIGRTARMHGAEVGAAMGVNTWAVFAGSPEAAVVDGDVAMLEGEVTAVLKALRRGGIEVVALHNHMTHEQPRYVFLHYWGRGRADDLARGLKAAIDTQAPR